jgi:hypothetical protein
MACLHWWVGVFVGVRKAEGRNLSLSVSCSCIKILLKFRFLLLTKMKSNYIMKRGKLV